MILNNGLHCLSPQSSIGAVRSMKFAEDKELDIFFHWRKNQRIQTEDKKKLRD
jgi:hypothetical protein